MFRFHKSLDVITLFHRSSLPSSVRVLALLKQASAQASETATEDQASSHTNQSKMQRSPFELNVTEAPPTKDQLRSILDYVGTHKAHLMINAEKDKEDPIKKLSRDPSLFLPPVTVDWNNGRAVIGDDESEIWKLVSKRPQ